jgi:hypothetical protein
VLWQFFHSPKHPAQLNQNVSSTTAGSTSAPGKEFKSEPVQIKDSLVQISSGPTLVSNWTLEKFRRDLKSESKIELHDLTHEPLGAIGFIFDSSEWEYLNQAQGQITKTENGRLVWKYEDEKVLLKRTIQASPDHPYLGVEFFAQFKKTRPGYAFVSVSGRAEDKDADLIDRKLVYWSGKSLNSTALKGTIDLAAIKDPVQWVGVTNRYFLLSVISAAPVSPTAVQQGAGPMSGRISMVWPIQSDTITVPVRVFFGPKELQLLHSVEPTLDQTVDFGWFTVVAYPLLRLMNWLFGFFQNYGVAIILLTVLVKLITLPLTYKSMKNMKEMARLQPQLKKIQDKHKDDREALQREMMSFMKTHKYNPMAGCWPMLIQMPIFFSIDKEHFSMDAV